MMETSARPLSQLLSDSKTSRSLQECDSQEVGKKTWKADHDEETMAAMEYSKLVAEEQKRVRRRRMVMKMNMKMSGPTRKCTGEGDLHEGGMRLNP